MSLTTSTFTRDGTAYPLPPQTTPFSPQADPCASTSIFCPWIIGEEASPLGSQVCTLGFTSSKDGAPNFNSQRSECYPPSFFTVFREDANADPAHPEDQDIITLAYPGSACPQNWATACSYDITVAASDDADGKATTSRQAWCCASGYQCTTASDDFGGSGGSSSSSKPFQRQCYSYLNSQTEVWASWDPPATPSGPASGNNPTNEYYTWPTSITWQPPQNQWTVFHKPLPLAVSSWSGEEEGEPAAPRATRTEEIRKEPVVSEPTRGV